MSEICRLRTILKWRHFPHKPTRGYLGEKITSVINTESIFKIESRPGYSDRRDLKREGMRHMRSDDMSSLVTTSPHNKDRGCLRVFDISAPMKAAYLTGPEAGSNLWRECSREAQRVRINPFEAPDTIHTAINAEIPARKPTP